MRCNKLVLMVCVFAGALALLPGARADEWDHMTTLTFSQPVEVPGIVLPAGTYVFRLLDSQTDRDVVQIFNKDRDHLFATIIAVPDYRLQRRGKTVVTFEEREAGNPQAIRAWFYPGRNYGTDFVYPAVRAAALAQQSSAPVPSMPEKTATNITKPITSAQAPEVAEMKQAPVTTQQPTSAAAQQPQAEQPQETQQPQEQAQAQAPTLPQTASDLPLIGLAGLLSLALAGALRLASQRAL
jgi:hypothetical protein